MEDKKRILIFSLAYHPFVGGAEVAIKEITQRLGDNFEFDMITVNLDGRQPDEAENFQGISKMYRLGVGKRDKYLFPWLAYNKALELQQKNGYDLIWAMMANQAGWAALKFKKKFPAVPYLLTLQEGDSELDIWLRTWFMRPLYKAIYHRADYIQAISNFLAKRAERLGAKCPVEVIPNGVTWKIASSCHNPNSYVLSVSRLAKKNGLEYLIKAMRNIDRELIIVGAGKLETKLKKLAVKLKLGEKIKFVGSVGYDEVHGYLRGASVFVRPSLSEGLGNAFLEAMADRVPIIGTSVGGIPDFLKDGETGWFCEVKNPQSIAEKINYILDEKNKTEVEKVITNAQKLVEEKYNWQSIASKISKIFSSLDASKKLCFKKGKLESGVIYPEFFPFKPTDSVLNLGCGDGVQALVYDGKFSKMVGVDINESSLKKAGLLMDRYGIKNFIGVVANIEEVPLTEKFDKIIAIDSIEHVVRPERVIAEAYHLLKDDGLMLMTFPAMHDKWEHFFSFVGRKILRRRPRTVIREGWDPDQHQYDYSVKEWLRLLSKGGFELVESRASTLFPPLHYLGLPKFWFTCSPIRFIDDLFCHLPLIKNYGQSFVVVFKKKMNHVQNDFQ